MEVKLFKIFAIMTRIDTSEYYLIAFIFQNPLAAIKFNKGIFAFTNSILVGHPRALNVFT